MAEETATAAPSALEAQLGKFIGTWKLESSDKFEDYMKAVEVGFVMRKIGATAKPNVTICVEGEECVLKSETTLTTHITKFKLGEEFQETTADGRKAQSTIEVKDGKLVQTQKGDGIVPSTITRELQDDDTLICICEAKEVVCKRVYKRIPDKK